MKIKFLFKLILILSLQTASINVQAQKVDLINYEFLESLLNSIKEAEIENADNLIYTIQGKDYLCPSLVTLVNPFASYKEDIQKKINDKKNQRNGIDRSVSQIKINGIVESKEKGYAIINSNGSYYAVKSNLSVGDDFRGGLIRSEGTIKYKPLGGNAHNVKVYTVGSGTSPQDKYASLTNQIQKYKQEYIDEWNKFKDNCISIVSAEISKYKGILTETHYNKGEEFLQNKDYDNAYKQFSYVYKINKDYKDVSQKLDLANNKNNIVRKSDVYNIVYIKSQNVSYKPSAQNKTTGEKIEDDYYLISTSNGIYESVDKGKIWKLKDYEGIDIKNFDAVTYAMVAVLPDNRIMIAKKYRTGTVKWNEVKVKYIVLYNISENDPNNYDKYEIVQPYCSVKKIKFAPSNSSMDNLFVEFEEIVGTNEQGKRSLALVRDDNWSWSLNRGLGEGKYYVLLNRDTKAEILKTCISPNYGTGWIAYYHNIFGITYFNSPAMSKSKVNDMVDVTEDYLEMAEDAIDLVKEYLEERKGIDEDSVKIIAHSYVDSIEPSDEDVIMVLTDYGLYQCCYDCGRIKEIMLPKEINNPISICYDKNRPNLIMIGLKGQGLIITRDGGKTWEGI